MPDQTGAPRARVYRDASGWKIEVYGEQVIGNQGSSHQDVMDFAQRYIRSRRVAWYARGCVRCDGHGVLMNGRGDVGPCHVCQPAGPGIGG